MFRNKFPEVAPTANLCSLGANLPFVLFFGGEPWSRDRREHVGDMVTCGGGSRAKNSPLAWTTPDLTVIFSCRCFVYRINTRLNLLKCRRFEIELKQSANFSQNKRDDIDVDLLSFSVSVNPIRRSVAICSAAICAPDQQPDTVSFDVWHQGGRWLGCGPPVLFPAAFGT